MRDGNSFPLVVCVFQVILAYKSIVLCMCSAKYIDIYFIMKITFFKAFSPSVKSMKSQSSILHASSTVTVVEYTYFTTCYDSAQRNHDPGTTTI